MMRDIACFGAAPGGGDLARVFEHDRSDAARREALAAKAGVNACVFIDTGPDGVPVLDYYYPHARSPLCLHATLADARVLLPAHGQLTVMTAMRAQRLALASNAEGLFITLEAQPSPVVAVDGSLSRRIGGMGAVLN
jgi:predicted PhzF superfamily epimerase YddE/YHI9